MWYEQKKNVAHEPLGEWVTHVQVNEKTYLFFPFGKLLKSVSINLSVQLPFISFPWRRPTVQHRSNTFMQISIISLQACLTQLNASKGGRCLGYYFSLQICN